jgi:hypothetical protein
VTGLGIGFFLLFLLNFAISWFNAWGVGRMWEESKARGGFEYFVTWCATIMSGCGFSWCYLFVLAFVAGTVPYHGHPFLAAKYVQGMLELGYVIIILPVLGSGIGITISTWRDFIRHRDLLSGAASVWNTYAMIHNTTGAIRVLPEVFKDLGGLLKDDDDRNATTLMIMLVVVALIGGFMTTFAIVRHTAATQRLRVQAELMGYRNQPSSHRGDTAW